MNFTDQPATKGEITAIIGVLEYVLDHIRYSIPFKPGSDAREEAENWRQELRDIRQRLYK